MKYQVNYTDNDGKFSSKQLNTKREIKKFLSENKSKIYWHQVIYLNAKSKRPKVILNVSMVEKEQRLEKKADGFLSDYYETGMDGVALIVDSNKDGEPSSLDRVYFIKKNDVVEIAGRLFIWVFDPEFAEQDAWRLSIYPVGYSIEEIKQMIRDKKHVVVYSMIADFDQM